MKYLLILTSISILLLSAKVNAADYYFCDCQAGASGQCVAGNDSNDGLSKLSPRKTFKNASTTFSNFFAGDSIQFCRGGAFNVNGSNKWVNSNCASSSVCSVTAYDMLGQESQQLARPIITQQANVSLFALDDGGNADHEEGYNFSNLDLKCTGCLDSGSGYAFFLYNDVDFVTINNITMDGFRIAVRLGGSNTPNSGSDGTLDNITLNRLSILNSKSQGTLGGANNLTIKNSYFENNGSGTVFDHHIYTSKGDNIIIKGNELYRSSLDINGSCTGVPIVVHGTINNATIENNVIHEDVGKANSVCWGIAVDPGYSSGESFTNIKIRGNKIINVGNIAIGVASCRTCIIENNVISQHQSFRFTGIKAPDRTRDSNDATLNNVTIRNNSIYTSSKGTGISLGTEGNQHVVVSNAIYYTGIEDFACFNFNLPTSSYTAVNNNVCYLPNASASSEWEAGSGNTPSQLSAWQTSGFGADSQNINPDFKSPSLPELNLSPMSAASPITNSGHSTLSAQEDYRGKMRDAQPDVGALEFGTFDPPAKTTAYTN